jgi:tetraacyldisaccharide 4'-kinase
LSRWTQEGERYLLEVIRGEQTGWASTLVLAVLTLLEQVYRLLLMANSLTKKRRGLPVPVISVGNLTAGGTGKTPTIVWLARELQAAGFRPAVLIRGYGGALQREGRVLTGEVLATATPEFIGDEPLLLAKLLPETVIAVGRDRYQMGMRALAAAPGAIDLFLLDDGFQYWGLQRQLDLVLLDATAPFSNRRLLPRGLLREPPAALKRAQVVLLTRTAQVSQAEVAGLTTLIKKYNTQAIVGEVQASNSTLESLATWGTNAAPRLDATKFLSGRRIGLVTAIGNPDQLQTAVRALGAEVVYYGVYPDHHVWDGVEVAEIIAALKMNQITDLLITAKDGVKLVEFSAELQLNEVDCYIINLDFQIDCPEIKELVKQAALWKG